MFNEVENMLGRVTTGEVDQSSVGQAASEHIGSMDGSQVQQQLQTAADNASRNGQGDVAQQIAGLISQHGSDPQALKQEAISLVTSNPQILEHFEPAFAKGILGRI